MLNDWIYLGIFLIIAFALPLAAIVLAGILSPKKPNPIKNSIYECGVEPIGDTRIQFKVQYYVYGLIYLIFDIETVLFLPLAVAYNQLTLYAVLEAILFVFILGATLLYAWRKGALEWV